MFSCCLPVEQPYCYQIRNVNQEGKEQVKIVKSLADVDQQLLNNQKIGITRLKTTHFQQLKNSTNKHQQQFYDEEFPPKDRSLGDIGKKNIQWKRISQIIQQPVLFDAKIQPKDVIHHNKGECYVLSSIAALAQYPPLIQRIFQGQSYNQKGIYKVNLRRDGGVQEIIVDDFIPVYPSNKPVFCQPNETGQFWVLILEKAFAKINGSYANILQGTPGEVFKAITYSPSESIIFEQTQQDQEKIWSILSSNIEDRLPSCVTTRPDASQILGLKSFHTYTFIAAAQVSLDDSTTSRLVRLRDPWAQEGQYIGQANPGDEDFWARVIQNEQRDLMTAPVKAGDYGLFTMTFSQLMQSFGQYHHCIGNTTGKFISQEFDVNDTAAVFDVKIKRDGQYTFQLSQPSHHQNDSNDLEVCRSSILIIKAIQDSQNQQSYEYIDGVLKMDEPDTRMTLQLEQGDYILYVKLDQCASSYKPELGQFSISSKHYAELIPAGIKKYPNLLNRTFLARGLQQKKKVLQDGAVWVSWQLLFKKGGLAYIAAGVQKQSKSALVIELDQNKMNESHFQLDQPYRGKGLQQIKVLPGQQIIILARIINNNVKNLRFPPPMDISLENI